MRREKNDLGQTEKEFLESYDPGDYDRPSATVDILLFSVDPELNDLKILLVKRKNHPFIDCWALPGGFVDMNESAYEAANRELKEETNLEGIYLEQLYTYTQPKRDPRMRVIDIAYVALTSMDTAVAGDDAADTAWFSITMDDEKMVLFNEERNVLIRYTLENKIFESGKITYRNLVPTLQTEDSLAFDHNLIILDGIARIRNKAEYSDVIFNLMDEEFTLPDLQRVYELVLGHSLYKKNFNDKVAEKVESTGGKIKSIRGNKLSAGYKYKKHQQEQMHEAR